MYSFWINQIIDWNRRLLAVEVRYWSGRRSMKRPLKSWKLIWGG